VLNAWALYRSPGNRKGAVSSTFTMATDIGMGIGVLIWGFIIKKNGFLPVFICGCVLLSLCAVTAFISMVPKRKPVENLTV
jgi:predicted MFS family arabinose efflux permease